MQEIKEKWDLFVSDILQEHDEDIEAAAGILLISPENKVLLQLRAPQVNNGDTYGTPGGHLVKGETWLSGAKREFYEETSYKGPFKDVYKLGMQRKSKPYVTFIARTNISNASEFKPLPEYEREVSSYEFFSFDEALDLPNLHPALRKLLENIAIMNKITKYLGKK